MKIQKSELKQLILEVINERWTDVLGIKPRTHTFNLYTTVDQWVEDMVDPVTGRYKGPDLEEYGFRINPYETIHQTNEPFHKDLIWTVNKWNDALAERNRISTEELLKANKAVEEHFYNVHAEDMFGYFPTQQ